MHISNNNNENGFEPFKWVRILLLTGLSRSINCFSVQLLKPIFPAKIGLVNRKIGSKSNRLYDKFVFLK